MDEYLCTICAEPCLDDIHDTIQCSNCQNWVHNTCTNLTKSDLKQWSVDYLQFLCKCCAFDGLVYNSSAALERLQRAMSPKDNTGLVNQAKSEQKLLQTYGVGIQIQDSLLYSSAQIDQQTVRILNMFHPIMNADYCPLTTIGDGNCLYRAVSLAVTGSQEHHNLLRLKTALELILNRQSYDTKRKNNDFLQDTRIVTSQYQKLVRDAVTDKTYSEMAHIYALSAALGIAIYSYFPPQMNPELSSAFTRNVYGRKVRTGSRCVLSLMWTSVTVPQSPKDFHVNHFVPLVPQTTCVNIKPVIVTCTNATETPVFVKSPDAKSVDVSGIDVSPVRTHASHEPETNESFLHHGASMIDTDDLPWDRSDSDETCAQSPCPPTNEQNEIANTPEIYDQGSLAGSSQSDLPTQVPDNLKGNLENGYLDAGTITSLLINNQTGLPKIPGGLKENVYFVVDNSKNIKKKDSNKSSAFSDDCGVWSRDAGTSPYSYYLLHENGDLSTVFKRRGVGYCVKKQIQKKVHYIPLDPQPDSKKIVIIQSYYTKSKSDQTYAKKACWLATESGLQSNLAVVQYVGKFPGLAPHGNSRQNTEYLRTPSEVLEEVKDMAGKLKPHQIYNKLKNKYDEVTRPTGLQQINDKIKNEKAKEKKHIGHSSNIADQIITLENMVSEGHIFVRSIIRNSKRSPCIILYTDEQIEDIKSLCSTGQTVLGIDKTFMLCKMHVTVTCYKQMTVKRERTGEPPLFIGPLFIHDNSDFDTYSHFFHHLKVKLIDTNLSKLVIGTDDEQALVKAITTIIPESTHVLCTRHLTENARRKLTDDAVDIRDRNDILKKIFGKNGIANADDTIDFDAKCDDFEGYCSAISENFLLYFNSRLRKHLKTKVNEPVREEAVCENWTNNNCESVNHVLKQTVDWKSKPLPEFVDLVQAVVVGQFKELRGALLGTGELRLADSHKHFETSKTEWIQMSEQQKTNLFKRYRKYVAKNSDLVVSSDGQSTVVAPRTNGLKPGPQRKRKINIKTTTVPKKKK